MLLDHLYPKLFCYITCILNCFATGSFYLRMGLHSVDNPVGHC